MGTGMKMGMDMFGRESSSTLMRSRWAGIGAAVAVSLGSGGLGWIAHAADSPPSSFVSITPCRLFDTRPDSNVGDRDFPLNAGEEFVRQVTGANGNCTIPAGANAIAYNLTVPTSIDGFLTLFPASDPRPTSSAINPVNGESVKANGGIVGLSPTGAIKVFTLTGPLDALLDITGYFLPAGASSPGGGGATSPFEQTIPSGQTVIGSVNYDGHTPGTVLGSEEVGTDLPGNAPVGLTNGSVNFASGAADSDPTCTGTVQAPTAPPGKVCLYLSSSGGINTSSSLVGAASNLLPRRSFFVHFEPSSATAGLDMYFYASWAYTAP
jgi:hypothetical protein